MKEVQVDKEVIEEKIDIIQKSLKRLDALRSLSPGNFMLNDNFAIAEHYLRYALEATFDICGHILARIPGAQAGEYKQMAIEMGRQRIMPQDFAEGTLAKMAGYRNRLTHFYFEVTPQEMHDIIQNNLSDFDMFLKHIKAFLSQ